MLDVQYRMQTKKSGFSPLEALLVFCKRLAFPRCLLGSKARKFDSGSGGLLTGFTFLELMLVVVIVVIAAMVAVPMVTSASSIQIRSAANLIASDLEYAKSMAITRGQSFSVVFDKTTESYSIKDQDGDTISHPVKRGFDYAMDFRSEGRLNKVNIVDADFDDTSEVKFDLLGSPLNGTGSSLNSGVITLQAGTSSMTITVTPVTGFISIGDIN